MLACLKQQLKETEIALMLYAWPQASTSLSYLKRKKFKCPKLFLFSGTEQLSHACVKHHAVVTNETVTEPAVHPLFCSDLHVER